MKFEAVLFDLDGTLLDTLEDLADSMNNVLNRDQLPVHGLEEYKYFVGEGMENLVRRALPDQFSRDAGSVAKYVELMREEYGKRWKEKTKPYETVPELLDALTQRGVKLAILSNKPDDFTRQVVAELLSAWRFETVRGERPPLPRKPDPTAAILIAEQLAVPPHQFVYVGDTIIDMKTGNGAGMYTVGALWGFRKADELLAGGAKALIKKPLELLGLL